MSKINKILIILFLVALATLSGVFLQTSTKESFKITEEKQGISIQSGKIFLEINNEKHESSLYEIDTVYDLMSSLRQEGKVDFKDKNYIALGKFIYEINGKRGNTDENWIYYVNGKKANVGVSNYKLNEGDVVSWRFENDLGF